MKTLLRRPLRSTLTLLQVLLGAVAMMVALSAYLGASQAQTSDASTFELVAGTRDEDGSESTYGIIGANDAEAILAASPDVERVGTFSSLYDATVALDGRLYALNSRGSGFITPDYAELVGLELAEGSSFSADDEAGSAPVMLLSEAAADILFPGGAVGQSLELMNAPTGDAGSERYTVVGTFKPQENRQDWEQLTALFPYWKAPDYGGGSELSVRAKPGRGEAARTQVVSAARRVLKTDLEPWNLVPEEVFYTRDPGENTGLQPGATDPAVIIFGLFGVVALIVGSIGIFSIMLVNALERERDTGLLRALGASRARIVRDFTLEAGALGLLGGLGGVLVAALVIPLLVAQVGSALAWQELQWQPLAAVIVLSLTALLGMLLGFFPALRASSVAPVDALKVA